MLYNDPKQQQPIAPPTYTPYRPGQGGPMVPITEKTQSVQLPAFHNTPQPGLPPPPVVRPPQPQRSRARGAAIFALTCLLAVVFGVGLFSGWQFARTSGSVSTTPAATSAPANTGQGSSTLTSLEAVQEAAIAKAKPAVVEIRGDTGNGIALGSGVIIDNKGNIVTNNHVVSGVSSLTVTLSDGTQLPAEIAGSDPANDLAVIRVQPTASMTPATFGDSAQLSVGQEVLAIGNPLGYDGTVTSGVVSGLNRTVDESRGVRLTGLIQISAPINPGNSGGALINLQGQVVGIPTLAAVNTETNTPANGIGFAIPSNTVQSVITRILGS
jgi:S1-C subfamily serine protease